MNDKIYRILAKFRNFVRGNTLIYKSLGLLRGKKEFYVNSNTDICLEGFPRSGNSFLTQLLRVLNPKLKIGHHTHSIVNLKLAFKKNIPIFIIIRNPIDALSSQVIRMNTLKPSKDNKNIINAITDYKQFYEFVLKNYNHLIVLNFNEATNSPRHFLKIVRENSNIDIPNPNKIDINRAIKEAFDRITKSNFKLSSKPDSRRSAIKNHIKTIIENNYFSDLNELIKLYNILNVNS